LIRLAAHGSSKSISEGRHETFPRADNRAFPSATISVGLPLEILSVSEVRQKTPFYF